MNKNDFFVKDELKEIKIEGQIFKYRPVNSGEELDWVDDYLVDKTEIVDGKEVRVKRQDFGKLSLCKLRNIMEVPFTTEELEKINGLKKDFKGYSNQEKDLLFRKLNPKIYNPLVTEIDKINLHKKKS